MTYASAQSLALFEPRTHHGLSTYHHGLS